MVVALDDDVLRGFFPLGQSQPRHLSKGEEPFEHSVAYVDGT
jgi:hypothetical protein